MPRTRTALEELNRLTAGDVVDLISLFRTLMGELSLNRSQASLDRMRPAVSALLEELERTLRFNEELLSGRVLPLEDDPRVASKLIYEIGRSLQAIVEAPDANALAQSDLLEQHELNRLRDEEPLASWLVRHTA